MKSYLLFICVFFVVVVLSGSCLAQPRESQAPADPCSELIRLGSGETSRRWPVHIHPSASAIGQSHRQADGTDVFVYCGGVYLYQMRPDENLTFELRATNAVVFYSQNQLLRRLSGGEGSSGSMAEIGQPLAVYMEGDVVLQLTRGQSGTEITADSVYYDLVADAALVIDGVLRLTLPDKQVPIYVRAAEIRQLSRDRFVASGLKLSNDEFYRPAVSLGASEAEIVLAAGPDRSDDGPASAEPARILSYDLRNVTAEVGGAPLFWWPSAAGTAANTDTPIKSARTSFSSDYGIAAETQWHLPWLLGLAEPTGFDSTLRLDEFTKRGPAAGIDIDYGREKYFGKFRSYLISDAGKDQLGHFEARKNVEPVRNLRGRVRLQHRHYLPHNWQGTAELSYMSDPDFLESFERREFDTDKEQETLLYFKQQRNNWAFDFLNKFHLNDFDYTLTELPTAGFYLAGQDIFELFTYYHDGFVARVCQRAGPRDVPGFSGVYEPSVLPDMIQQDNYAFAVSRHELSLPLQLGGLKFAPTVIGTYVYDDSGESRSFVQGAGGFRASTQFWRLDDTVRSRIFNLHRLRHVIVPQVSAFWVDSDAPQADSRNVFNFAINQRWQTKRRGEDLPYSVDFFRWDCSVTLVNHDVDDVVVPNKFFFSHPETQFGLAPILNADLVNLGLAHRRWVNQNLSDHATTSWEWLISDTTILDGHMNYDIHNGLVSSADTGLALERSPRTSLFFGDRYLYNGDVLEDRHTHYFTSAAGYKLSRKYTVGVSNSFDIERTSSSYSNLVVIRKFPHWFGAFSFGYDSDRNSFSFQLSFWPEGFDKISLGSRRFAKLAK